jgi:hypothetical protein
MEAGYVSVHAFALLPFCLPASFSYLHILTPPSPSRRRLTQDRSSLADEYDTKYMFHALKDWKIWVHMFITIGIYTPLYSISLFMPTIVRGTFELLSHI